MTARRLAAAAAGAAGSALAYAGTRVLPSRARRPWERRNHAGAPVTLLEGPAHVVGLVTGALVGGVGGSPVLAAAGAGALGALDDLAGDTSAKGLRGHLRAAREGQVTTGLVKIAGLGVLGVVAAAAQDARRRGPSGPSQGAALGSVVADALLGGAVVAGTANLLNLFDLRPGRPLKVGLLIATPLVLAGGPGAPAAAAVIGASVGSLGPDLRGEAMLGDTGANALGALLGTALIATPSRGRRVAVLSAVTGLTLLSEKVSFTSIIESTPVLRSLDAWGRPPQ